VDRKVIVITGASGGIGAALARHLGSQGHQLVLAARRKKELREVAEQSGSQVVPVVCDVTHRHEVEYLKNTALQSFSRVDVWINNAGRGITRKVMDLTDDDLDAMFDVNLRSALYGMQSIIPYFQTQQKGHLINISSFLARVPLVTFRSAYSAAKAGLSSLTANLRVDLATTFPDVHVSLVMPGVVLTEFGRNALGGAPQASSSGMAPAAQSAEEVAATIAELIENPKPEIYTNPASHDLVKKYYEDVGAFEFETRK
jgi:short-subunit dehydrogenase